MPIPAVASYSSLRPAQRGFTLIEVMVALTIFAFCAISMHYVLSQSVDGFTKIERKTVASWVAENKLVELRLMPQLPPVGEEKADLTYGGREWSLVTAVKNADDPRMRRVEISVYTKEGNRLEGNFATTLFGFVGKFD